MDTTDSQIPNLKDWAKIIGDITSPIKLIALLVLVAFCILGVILFKVGFTVDQKWAGFLLLFWLIPGILVFVLILAAIDPKILVYGEHGHLEESKQKIELEKYKLKISKSDSDSH